jgi:hypothetical protein
MKWFFSSIVVLAFLQAGYSTGKPIEIVHQEKESRVDIFFDGALFTSYIYQHDLLTKPVLFPLNTHSGKALTRGYPLAPVEGERVDHPHHIGHWLNYGDVNGIDFWNYSTATPKEKISQYGSTIHQSIESIEVTGEVGILKTKSIWRTNSGENLLEEYTTFTFSKEGNTRIISRSSTLEAMIMVSFHDNKEGMCAIRVSKELELPMDKPAIFLDAKGNPSEVPKLNTGIAKGNYLSNNKLEGNDVWGTRGKWVQLYSKMEGEDVALAIIDHPDNVGYPTYWHARNYGLFSANPLGQKVFSEGKEVLNFKLKKGESTTFKYQILVHSGSKLSPNKLDKFAVAFAKK